MKVSVVIPVFNEEAFLRECLDSVLAQTHRDIEVILSDDGSSDASGAICDSYAAADSRVRVIHAPNRGQSVARNRALDAVAGEYVFFVDSDDVIHPRMVEILLEALEAHRADVAWSAYTFALDKLADRPGRSVSVDGVKATELFLYQRGLFAHGVGGVLVRRTALGDMRFREGIRYEDLDLLPFLLVASGRVVVCEAPLYFYRPHPASIIGRWRPARADVLDVTARIEKAFSHRPALLRAARERSMSAAFNIFVLNARHENDPALASRCFAILRERRGRGLLNPKVRLKSKAGILASYLGPRVLSMIGRL